MGRPRMCPEHMISIPCGACRADALERGVHRLHEAPSIEAPDVGKLAAHDTDDDDDEGTNG